MPVTIRRLTSEDAEASVALRQEMLLDSPSAFSASPEDDLGSRVEVVRERLSSGPGNFQLGAFAPELVGSVGMFREPKLKTQHRLYVWGMYVTPASRGQGLGKALLQAAIAHGRQLEGVTQIHLGVNEVAVGARALYESVGFNLWGTEPRAILVDGRYYAEHHLALDL